MSEAIAYRPGTTTPTPPPPRRWSTGEGVCQDHAHALIALAHAAGLPARYVTGYLLAGDDGGAGEASHAWAEIHVRGLGWVGFDAANECCPDERYIRLGSGRDALDAAPIRGMSRGGGGEAMDVTVVVATPRSRRPSSNSRLRGVVPHRHHAADNIAGVRQPELHRLVPFMLY